MAILSLARDEHCPGFREVRRCQKRQRSATCWDPDQYSKFAAERAKPFFDLLAMVHPVPGGDVIDLGCGTGELTAQLHAQTRAAATLGMDASEAMLAKARPLAGNGLRFESGDIGRFDTEAGFDLVFANASLQWVSDHPRLLRQLAAGLAPRRAAGRPGPCQRRSPLACRRHRGGARGAVPRPPGCRSGTGHTPCVRPRALRRDPRRDRFLPTARAPAGLRSPP